MTSNQINLGKLREDIRHHGREETLGFGTLAETSRHNKRSEAIGFGQIGLGYSTLGETQRHNIATEGYQSQLSLAQAQLASDTSGKTRIEAMHYLDELAVRQKQAEAALSQADTAQQRADIEQQLADIKEQMMTLEKIALGAEAAKDISSALFGNKGAVSGVVGILDQNKPK